MLYIAKTQTIMKRILITLISIILLMQINAQQTEYSVKLNSGLFSFSGQSAQNTAFIVYNTTNDNAYTGNPYGSLGGLSYGMSGTVNRITKNNIIFGIDLGYEILKSKVNIDSIWISDRTNSQMIEANGKTFLNNRFINLYPSIGYRFKSSNLTFDISGGIDIGYNLGSTEKGNASSGTNTYKTNRDRTNIKSDFRPRLEFGISKNKLGLYIAYSKGIKNYLSGMLCGSADAYGNVFRFGIKYKIK